MIFKKLTGRTTTYRNTELGIIASAGCIYTKKHLPPQLHPKRDTIRSFMGDEVILCDLDLLFPFLFVCILFLLVQE